MRQTDILIAGGGLAGSAVAAMLGRAGTATVLVDPHAVYPPDFRAEKLDSTQVAVLRKTGVGEAVLRAATLDGESWVARASAACSRSARATSTASCTTRWSTRCAARFRRASTSSTPR